MDLTLIFVYFRSLSLAHMEKSLYSLSKQTIMPARRMLFDNNSPDSEHSIRSTLALHFDPKTWALYFMKHGDPAKTLGWGANHAIWLCDTETFVFARADFIYTFDFIEKLLGAYAGDLMSYAAPWIYQMNYFDGVNRNPDECGRVDLEVFDWRKEPRWLLRNAEGSRTEMNSHRDGPNFCTSKTAVLAGGGWDETLTGWGYDQQDAQTQMARNGVVMKTVKEPLAFHMDHAPTDGDRRFGEKAMQRWMASPRRSPEESAWIKANYG